MLLLPDFNAQHCVRYRYSYSECSRCADVCPHDAIHLFDAGVELLADACQSCALCVGACPTEALTDRGVSAENILKLADSKKMMTVACTPSGAGGDVIVSCLGAINSVVLAEISRRGVALEFFGTNQCSQCVHASKGPDMIRLNLEAREILCGLEETKEWATLTNQGIQQSTSGNDGHDATRRGLFRSIIEHGRSIADGEFEAPTAPLKAIRAAAVFLPQRRKLLTGLYDELGEHPLRVARHPSIPAEDWSIAEGCTNCEACVRVCPTGALQLLENNAAWRIVLLNERCVACGVCAEACQPGVLRLRAEAYTLINKQKARLLRGVSKQRCTRCDRVFATEDGTTICPICSGDDTDFASIFGS